MLYLGVSSTVILMIMGVYDTYLCAISMINMNVLGPMMIGAFAGSFIFMKLIKSLLLKFRYPTIMGIIGFSLGSIFVLYPKYHLDLISIVSLIILLIGFYIGKSFQN